MTKHQSHTPQPRQDFDLTLAVLRDNAPADSTSVNTVQATLKDGNDWASGEAVQFIVTTGHAVFADNGSNITTGIIGSQGSANASLTDAVEETATVIALGGGISKQVTVTFGHGGGSGDTLDAPTVDEAVNGRIPVDTAALTLRIPPWNGMAVGDHLEYTWVGINAGGVESTLHDGFPLMASDIGQPVIFNLSPVLAVAPFDGGTAEAWYTVTPEGGSMQTSANATWLVGEERSLPAPVVEEATDGHINLEEVGDTFSVDLSWPQMSVNDLVSLYWQGMDADGNAGSEQVAGAHRVTDADAFAGQVVLALYTETYLMPYEDGSVSLFYTLNRADGSPTAQSGTSTYGVNAGGATAGDLWVVGARETGWQYHVWQGMVALDKGTRLPVRATWQYEGETVSLTGERFTDSRPDKILIVSSGKDTVRLRALNIAGNGDPLGTAMRNAYAVCLDSGQLRAWGDPQSNAATLPEPIAALDDITSLNTSDGAFVAQRANTSLVAWGTDGYGGTIPENISHLHDISNVIPGGQAFAALRQDNSVVAWGSRGNGGDTGSVGELYDISKVTGSVAAFSAIRTDNSVVAWGNNDYGGDVSSVSMLRDVVSLIGNKYAIAALRQDNRVVAWGKSNSGGDVPATIAGLRNIVAVVGATSAFAAPLSDGSVVAWGWGWSGGSLPADIASLRDIISIAATDSAFAALRADGSVVAWGSSVSGGQVSDEVAILSDIVHVTGNYNSFSALRQDGSIVSWGNEKLGGNSENVSELRNVRAIYRVQDGFFALGDDNRLSKWGDILPDIPSDIQGGISYLIK